MVRADTERLEGKHTASGAMANPSAAGVGMRNRQAGDRGELDPFFLSRAIRRCSYCAMSVIVWLNLEIALAEY